MCQYKKPDPDQIVKKGKDKRVIKECLWFFYLWICGLLVIAAISFSVKALIRLLK